MLAPLVSLLAVALVAGCGAADDADAASSTEDLTALSLTFGGSAEAPELADSPPLTPGATGTLACRDRFEIDGRVRFACTRGAELGEVILDAAAHRAVVVYRPLGRTADKRAIYECTQTGDPSRPKLGCQPKAPTTHGGGLASPFASTVPGVSIPNAHVVGQNRLLLRGMAPREDAELAELQAAGVQALVVFKNATNARDEVREEIEKAESRFGIAADDAIGIPFKWKDIGPFQAPCEQTAQALDFIRTRLAENKKTYFHCTVGEDRTGTLAALERLAVEPSLTPERAWDEEMCERGYGAGNPLKPVAVTKALEESLRPLYRKLSWLVKRGALDAAACATDPAGDAAFEREAVPLERLTCGTSTRFEP